MTIKEVNQMKKIDPRYSDPSECAELGSRAAEKHPEWERENPGKFLAIHGGQLIAVADTYDELMKWLMDAQTKFGRFRAYTFQSGGSTPVVDIDPKNRSTKIIGLSIPVWIWPGRKKG